MNTEAHGIADDQVRSAFQRWKNLEEEKARIGDDLKELFAEQKAFGHDTKAMRAAFRLKVKMDEARPEDAEHEALVDTYLAALEAPRATRAYARENIEQSDVNPRLIKQVVDGMQTAAGRAALVSAVDVMIEREEAEERRSDGGLSIQTKHEDIRTAPVTADGSLGDGDGATVAPNGTATSGMEVTAGETATNSITDAAISRPELDRPEIEDRSDKEAPEAGASGGMHDESAFHPAALSEKATVATQGEATEATSAEREDRAAANAGGTDVDGGALRAKPLVTGEGAENTALPANGVTLEYVPASGVKRLPFAHCFPELSKADYERLERDIAANRVQTPIIRRDGVIIDGWARYMISRQYGMSYPVQEYTGCDMLLDVIEWQRASRNFTQAQEKKIAADLAKAMPDRADEIMAAFGLAETLEAAE